MKKISSKLRLKSSGFVPKIDGDVSNCLAKQGLIVPVERREKETEADFLLVVGRTNKKENFMAFASYCAQGRNLFLDDDCRKTKLF